MSIQLRRNFTSRINCSNNLLTLKRVIVIERFMICNFIFTSFFCKYAYICKMYLLKRIFLLVYHVVTNDFLIFLIYNEVEVNLY